MAKIELKGFDVYIRQIEALAQSSEKMCKAVVYPGAAVLANKLRAATEALPTISDAESLGNFRSGRVNEALSVSQKAGLLAGFGITNIRRDRKGMIQASVGFDGYNSVKTRHFPNGQPNPEVARSLEKGTSYLKRNRFVAGAVKAAEPEAIAAMQEEADAYIAKKMQENGG